MNFYRKSIEMIKKDENKIKLCQGRNFPAENVSNFRRNSFIWENSRLFQCQTGEGLFSVEIISGPNCYSTLMNSLFAHRERINRAHFR